MSFKKAWFLITLIPISISGYTMTSHETELSRKLIGEWQPGLNHETKNIPTIEAFSLGFVGAVWRFNEDNTLVIYVPCGIDIPLKLKDKIASGTWEIKNNDYLHIHINEKGDWDRDTDQTLYIETATDADGFETLRVEQTKFGRINSKTVNCGEPLQ